MNKFTGGVLNFNRIKTKENFIKWADVVNLSFSNKDSCNLQDIFSRSNLKELKELFINCDGEKRIILFSIIKNQGEDVAFEFINSLAHHKVKLFYNEDVAPELKRISEEDNRIYLKEEELKKREEKIKSIEILNKQLHKEISASHNKTSELNKNNIDLSKKLYKIRDISHKQKNVIQNKNKEIMRLKSILYDLQK